MKVKVLFVMYRRQHKWDSTIRVDNDSALSSPKQKVLVGPAGPGLPLKESTLALQLPVQFLAGVLAVGEDDRPMLLKGT